MLTSHDAISYEHAHSVSVKYFSGGHFYDSTGFLFDKSNRVAHEIFARQVRHFQLVNFILFFSLQHSLFALEFGYQKWPELRNACLFQMQLGLRCRNSKRETRKQIRTAGNDASATLTVQANRLNHHKNNLRRVFLDKTTKSPGAWVIFMTIVQWIRNPKSQTFQLYLPQAMGLIGRHW